VGYIGWYLGVYKSVKNNHLIIKLMRKTVKRYILSMKNYSSRYLPAWFLMGIIENSIEKNDGVGWARLKLKFKNFIESSFRN
jgi:hypothetical protein